MESKPDYALLFDYVMITKDGPVPYTDLYWFEEALERGDITKNGDVYSVKTYMKPDQAEVGDLIVFFGNRLHVWTHQQIFESYLHMRMMLGW